MHNATDSQRIEHLFVTALARRPEALELDTMTTLLENSRQTYGSDAPLARTLLGTSETQSDSQST